MRAVSRSPLLSCWGFARRLKGDSVLREAMRVPSNIYTMPLGLKKGSFWGCGLGEGVELGGAAATLIVRCYSYSLMLLL